MRYFELEDDMTGIPRWHLDRVVSTDGSVPSLRAGVKCDLTDLQVAVHHAGPSLQFTMTTFGVPIAVLPLSIAFTSLAQNDVQILPCAVSGDCGYAAINVLRILPCIDDALTVGIKWTADDHRSDLAGQYRRIDKLMVDPLRYGLPLRRGLKGLMKLRVGDYRVIYSIEKEIVTVQVIKIGHRRHVYGD